MIGNAFAQAGGTAQGGDMMSARDMAIVGRAVLASPELSKVVSTKRFDFVAPNGESRYVVNHNRMLNTYPGTIGLKTGSTNAAGICLVAVVHRGTHTLGVVLLHSPNIGAQAMQLFNAGFRALRGV